MVVEVGSSPVLLVKQGQHHVAKNEQGAKAADEIQNPKLCSAHAGQWSVQEQHGCCQADCRMHCTPPALTRCGRTFSFRGHVTATV